MTSVKLSKIWDSLQSSYWFIPGLMAIASIALAFAMLSIDRAGVLAIEELSWMYRGGPEGARGLLAAVSGSMVTVAATAFSITIVALQLAAANFGPRLLRNFMQDMGNQLVLGTFIATFLYCLLVLRTIHGEDYNLFVPHLSVTVSLALAIASIGVLIYFIHHASTIIQASYVIASVSDELEDAIDRLFPEAIGHGKPEQQPTNGAIPKDFDQEACPIQAEKTGYLQFIDDNQLMRLACQHNLLLRLVANPGEFISRGKTLVLVYPQEWITPKLTQRIQQAFLVGRERTEQQDIEFPINQLVEIALRALSPGINDPFTAIRCIDRLSAGLSALAERKFPSAYRYGDNHKLRVIAEPAAFEQLVNMAFDQIRHYGKSDVVVMLRLLKAIAEISRCTHRSRDRMALQQQAEMIMQGSREGLSQERDQTVVEELYRQLLEQWR